MRIAILLALSVEFMSGQSIARFNDSTGSTASITAVGLSGSVITNGTIWSAAPTFVVPPQRKHNQVTLAQVHKAAFRIAAKDLAPAEYITLAKSIGAEASAEEAAISQAISDLGLPVYDFEKVDDYLVGQTKKYGPNVMWVWKPVGKKDYDAVFTGGRSSPDATMGVISPATYGRPLPMVAMENIAALMKVVPEAVFLVTDYEVRNPDPFLAISSPTLLRAGKLWVVSQWDEPGFGVPAATRLTAKR